MLIGRGVTGVYIGKDAEAGFDLTSILHPSCPQIATKSPYLLSLSACLNFGHASSSLGIRTTLHFSQPLVQFVVPFDGVS